MKAEAFRNAQDISSRLVVGETTECEVLDFKTEIVLKKHAGPGEEITPAKDLAVDIVSMANTYGGSILVGVEEGDVTNGTYKVAAGFKSVLHAEEIKEWLDNAVRSQIHPRSLPFSVFPFSLATGETLIAINVPAYENLASIWSPGSNSIKYPYRTAHGNRYFFPSEVEERILSNTRRTELFLHRHLGTANAYFTLSSYLCIERLETEEEREYRFRSIQMERRRPFPNEHGQQVVYESRLNEDVGIGGLSEEYFTISYNGRKAAVPFGAVSEVWIGLNERIHMVLRPDVVVPNDPTKKVYLDFQNRWTQ